jgi:nucleoside-diphosphate-sugar epimerase
VKHLLLLGVGTIARALRASLPKLPAFGTTRSAPDARFATITPLAAADAAAIRAAAQGAGVVVSFPPDGHSDAEFAALGAGAASIVYLSSTAVYPSDAGLVNEATPVTTHGERAVQRLAAEALWRKLGASVLRLPAFYGPESGLHLSIARGTFRMPGRGTNIVSRVHVDDAARFVAAALDAAPRSLILAGDDTPAPLAEVVTFVCDLFGLELPQASEGTDIPLSLRGSRSVDNSVTKARYGVRLAYPSYREGYRTIRELGQSTRVD